MEETGKIILCFKLKAHTFEVLGGFGFSEKFWFWAKLEKSILHMYALNDF